MSSVGLIYGGAGSAAVAAKQLGMEISYNYEPRGEHFLKTFKKNFGGDIVRDWCFIGGIPKVGEYKSADIIVGQPDCKIFSNLRTRKKETIEIKNTQLASFFYFIGWHKPKAFIVENLPKAIDAIFPLLKSDYSFLYREDGENNLINYNLNRVDINSNVFLPQNRLRSFIVGVLSPWAFVHLSPPLPIISHGCISLLKDLEHPESYKIHMNHQPPKHSDERKKGFSKLEIGESYYGTQNNRRIDPNKPAPTITSHCTQHVHYKHSRTLTVRENARLMGWPDTFEFIGGVSKQLDQVGKAIVVPVIRYLLRELLDLNLE